MPAYLNSYYVPSVLARQLTPMALRDGVIGHLFKEMLSPVHDLAVDLRNFRVDKRFRLKYNGQVRLLENVVNCIMVGTYTIANPVIYLDETTPVEEFLLSPDGNWERQGNIHYDADSKEAWDAIHDDPPETPEAYGILHDHTSRPATLGFEVHLTPVLAPDAPDHYFKTRFYDINGGIPALRQVVDAYKLAGKRYVVIQDQE